MRIIRQTKNSGNTYWNDLLYKVSHDVTSSSPTVTTDNLAMGFSLNAMVYGTIVSAGSSAITQFGFVYATEDNPTIDNSVELQVGEPVGSFSANITSLPMFELVYFAAFATNSVGTSYGEVLSGETEICLAAGTKVTLANGYKKNIEDITYSDNLLVWDFDNGCLGSSKPVWMVKPFRSYNYGLAKFSNGEEIKTVADGRGHRVFNYDKGLFTYSMNDDTSLGSRSFTENGKLTRVVDRGVFKEDTIFYNIITERHFNIFANGILTSTGLNNLYPVRKMKFVKEPRVCKNNFNVPDKLVSGLRLLEQPVNYPDLGYKLDLMMKRMR